MKINAITLSQIQQKQLQKETPSTEIPNIKTHADTDYLPHAYNDHLVSFGARVEKDINRFSDKNETLMPDTVKTFLKNHPDTNDSPMQVHQKAFAKLADCKAIDDIQKEFPNETLFKSLIPPEENNARVGIIKYHNDFAPLLEQDGKGILKTKENLTVYLVKKIFLENKTVEEINKDLDTDLDEDFKKVFLFHNEDAKYVHSSTLTALGIKAPHKDYRHSLRYTVGDYADQIGAKIKIGLDNFYDSLTDKEKTYRAKKSVTNFDNWWKTLTYKQKLIMLDDKEAELKMLQLYKQHKSKNTKKTKASSTTTSNNTPKKHVKIGSTTLANDELFKKWATFNLQIYRENLSDIEKNELKIIQARKMSNRWHDMSALERTEYISKMKAGQEPLRYAMIDAWNNCTDIIKDLSIHLKKNQIYKPSDLLYSTQEFSEFQSEVMSEFWATHPQHAEKLGEAIKAAHTRVENAQANGHFEELKREISREKTRRIKEIDAFKLNQLNTDTKIIAQEADYMTEFRQAYMSTDTTNIRMKLMPQAYIDDYFAAIKDGFNEEEIKLWTKNIRGEYLTEEEITTLKKISSSEPPSTFRMNRAIEAACANVLYDCTKDPRVFAIPHYEAKTAITQILRGEKIITLNPYNESEAFTIPILNRKIDKNKIASLYQNYKESLTPKEIENIIDSFFNVTDEATQKELEEILQKYGKAANIMFAERSAFPDNVKQAAYLKFTTSMNDDLYQRANSLLENCKNPFAREAKIKRLNFLFSKRFDFIPKAILEKYATEFGKMLRLTNANDEMLTQIERKITSKRTDPKGMAGIVIVPKYNFSVQNKLRMLAAEQVLAERLYEVTENPKVFTLQFEELCDNIECFNLIRKFPSETRHYPVGHLHEDIDLTPIGRIDLKNIAQEYIECINDVIDNWLNKEVADTGFGKLLSLSDTLANGETNPKILENIIKRINLYHLRLK